MMLVYRVAPGPDQRRRIEVIRERASRVFSKHNVVVEEDFADLTAYLSITVTPDPPYGSFGRHFVVPYEELVYWDWSEKSN
jgi:hypothetical protein